MIDVQGRCPACRWQSLFLGDGGHVTCSRLECPDPCAADQLLHGENGPAATGATERSDIGTEFVRQVDQLDEANLAAFEARLAQSGIDTPGCDCGHEGMGVSWHSDDCDWRRKQVDPTA